MSEAILSIPQFNSSTDNLPLTTIHDSISAKGINAGSSKTISLGKTILFAVISHGESGTENGRVKGVGIDGSNVLIGYTWAPSSNPSYWYLYAKISGNSIILSCTSNSSGGGSYWGTVEYCAIVMNM